MSVSLSSIFISSVQKELAQDRRAVKAFIENDPLLRRFFTVFLFEDLPAGDRRADAVYLAEVDRCAVYLGLFGNDYGFEDAVGFSPTEREFDRATVQGKPRLVFVKGAGDKQRHPKMQALIHKAGNQLIRRRYDGTDEVVATLRLNDRQKLAIGYLKTQGKISNTEYQQVANSIKKTATRDLSDLKEKGIIEQIGNRGPGVCYILAKRRDKMGTMGT